MALHATQDACLAQIAARRWPSGFVCPHCRHAGGYPLSGRRGFECGGCGKQTSITSGTAFAFLKLPLPKVFLAMYLIAANKQGISGKSLAKHLGCSLPTSWHLLHKFRHAMLERDAAYQLSGLVEVDEAYVGGIAAGTGMRGRSTKHKTPVVAMVEKRGDNHTGYIGLRPIPNVKSATLLNAITDKIKPGSQIRTDALGSYACVGENGFTHLPELSLGGKRSAVQFKLVHRQISNFKSWLLGTHRNTCRRHLDLYTAEYAWRTNRRNRYSDGKADDQEQGISDRLLTAMVCAQHWTWTRLRKQRWECRKSSAA
jgi:transposase-like protein